MRWQRAWPHVRAALVLVHGAAVLALAVPSLSAGTDRSSWADPTVQGELHAWGERLGIPPRELEETAWQFAQRWIRLHAVLVAPFVPYRTYVGVRQPWVMFVAPQRYPVRIEIDLLEAGQWRTIYRERSDTYAWKRRLFDHDRLRAVFFRFGWDKYGYTWRDFADWVAVEAGRDFPGATAVRLRMLRFRTLSPDEVKAGQTPEGRWEKELVRELRARP